MMENLVDIHCHILPELDDGADSEREMINMVRIAYEEGIRVMIATPHFHPYRGCAPAEKVLRRFAKYQRLIAQNCPGMKIYEGNEIYYQSDIVTRLKQGEVLTMANSQYVLVEFSPSAEAAYIRDALSEFLFAGYCPIIAHIERYDSLMQDMERVKELVEAGSYVQINSGSVTGESGGKTKKQIRQLLKEDLVHFVGTDAHHERNRAPYMKKCARYIEKKYGEERAEQLFCINPASVIQNKLI